MKCLIVVMTTAWAHLSEEVHLPQQIAEHGINVVHLIKETTEASETILPCDKNRLSSFGTVCISIIDWIRLS